MSKIICPYCQSTNIIKRGRRKLERGDVQVYGCKGCDRRFTTREVIKKGVTFVIVETLLGRGKNKIEKNQRL